MRIATFLPEVCATDRRLQNVSEGKCIIDVIISYLTMHVSLYSLLDSSSGLHLDLVYYRCVCINTTCMEFLYGGLFWLIHHLSYHVTELTVDCVIMMGRRLQQSKDGPTNSASMHSFRNPVAQSGLSLRNLGDRCISLDIKAQPAHWPTRNSLLAMTGTTHPSP